MQQELNSEQLAVIEKVRKLLALAGNNSNEAEAALAADKATQLLEAYNLDISHANGKKDDRGRERKAGGLYPWQRTLWAAVAKLNFCKYYYVRGLHAGSKYEHEVIGRKVNVLATENMAHYLQDTINRHAMAWAKERNLNVFCRAAIAYRDGMADRLYWRLQELRDQRIKEERERSFAAGNGNGRGLVLADVIQQELDLNNDFECGLEPGTTAARRAKAEADRLEAERILREWAEANPEKAAELAAKEKARAEKANAEWERKWNKTRQRSRKMTAEEIRASMPSYREGYHKAADIGLDRQVGSQSNRRLK